MSPADGECWRSVAASKAAAAEARAAAEDRAAEVLAAEQQRGQHAAAAASLRILLAQAEAAEKAAATTVEGLRAEQRAEPARQEHLDGAAAAAHQKLGALVATIGDRAKFAEQVAKIEPSSKSLLAVVRDLAMELGPAGYVSEANDYEGCSHDYLGHALEQAEADFTRGVGTDARREKFVWALISLDQRRGSPTAQLSNTQFDALIAGFGRWVYVKAAMVSEAAETAADIDWEAQLRAHPSMRVADECVTAGAPKRVDELGLCRFPVQADASSLRLIDDDEVKDDDWAGRKFRVYRFSIARLWLSVSLVNRGCVQVRAQGSSEWTSLGLVAMGLGAVPSCDAFGSGDLLQHGQPWWLCRDAFWANQTEMQFCTPLLSAVCVRNMLMHAAGVAVDRTWAGSPSSAAAVIQMKMSDRATWTYAEAGSNGARAHVADDSEANDFKRPHYKLPCGKLLVLKFCDTITESQREKHRVRVKAKTTANRKRQRTDDTGDSNVSDGAAATASDAVNDDVGSEPTTKKPKKPKQSWSSCASECLALALKEEPAILSPAGTAWQMLADRMRRHDHYFCNDDIRAHYYTQTFQVTHLKNLTYDPTSLTVDQEAQVRTSSREQTFVASQL